MTEQARPDEGFLRRWARRKTETQLGLEPAPGPDVVPAPVPAPAPVPDVAGEGADTASTAPALPTMDDVARLTRDSDFSAFVGRGVDQAVRRTALKKLFADPHFNTMDGLDVYIDDYTKPSPVSEAMLASLEHAKSVWRHMVDDAAQDAAEEAPAAGQAPAADVPAPDEPRAPTQQLPEQETR